MNRNITPNLTHCVAALFCLSLAGCSGQRIVRQDYEVLLSDARKQMEATRAMPVEGPLSVLAIAVIEAPEPPPGSEFTTLDETTRVAQQALYKALADSSFDYQAKPREFYERLCRELGIAFPAGIGDVVNRARLLAELNRRGENVDYVLLTRIHSKYDEKNDLAELKVGLTLSPASGDDGKSATGERTQQYRPYRSPFANALRWTWMPIEALFGAFAAPAKSKS